MISTALIGTWITALALGQFCPSYTLSSTNNNNNCGVEAVNGTNPTVTQWQNIFQLVAQGPSVWGSSGPSVPDIGQGCGKPMPTIQVPAKFPCELLKAIAQVESNWTQFCVPSTPADQVGGPSRTIISFDCGYGIGQVTSGMHIGESPNFDRARVASDPTYNMATGTRILGDKWRATRCVGDNQPSIIEHWYSATWAYNGLSYTNNPNNPNFSSTRGVYNPAVNGAAPYQEKVFGRMQYPTGTRWTSVSVAYPRLQDIGTTGSPNTLPDPTCGSPTSCATTRGLHVSSCFQMDGGMMPPDSGTGGGGGSNDAGIDGGSDAGVDGGTSGGVDGGERSPVIVNTVSLTLGPASGCGCDAAPSLFVLICLALLRRGKYSLEG